MIRKFAVLGLAVALASPIATAHAVGTKTYDVCGGEYSSWTGFAFCASVQITVVKKSSSVYNLALQIANMSGLDGSYYGSVFTQIGIDNISGHLANPANIVVTQNGHTVCTNTTNNQSTSQGCWNVKEDVSAAGGINVDFLDQSSNGVNRDISSLCLAEPTLLYTCLAASPVTISFDITTDFNPQTAGQVYIRSGSLLGYSECETGTTGVPSSERCTAVSSTFGVTQPSPPVTSTPEPATLVLMGSGLMGLGPMAFKRRRKKDSNTPPVA